MTPYSQIFGQPQVQRSPLLANLLRQRPQRPVYGPIGVAGRASQGLLAGYLAREEMKAREAKEAQQTAALEAMARGMTRPGTIPGAPGAVDIWGGMETGQPDVVQPTAPMPQTTGWAGAAEELAKLGTPAAARMGAFAGMQQAAQEAEEKKLATTLAARLATRKPSASIQGYEYAKNQGYEGTYEQWRKEMAAIEAQSKAQMVPPSAPILQMEADARGAIGSIDTINSEMKRYADQIRRGDLDLGLITNIENRLQLATGLSDQQARNYGSFIAGLERLRNESLRLNKGIQTEGDAVRAWNELIANVNDPKFVQQRLSEIQTLNNRAKVIRQGDLNVLYGQYPQLRRGMPQRKSETEETPTASTLPETLPDTAAEVTALIVPGLSGADRARIAAKLDEIEARMGSR